MLAFCILAREAILIRNAAEFSNIKGKSELFVSADIEFAFMQQFVLENVQLDCLSHAITAESPPFDVVANITIRNCVFYLKNGLSTDFNSSALVNSTIVVSGFSVVFKRTYLSVLVGVRSSTVWSFAVNASNATFVGCAFQHNYEGADQVAALFNNTKHVVFQNTFFNLSVRTRNQKSVAGLTISGDSTTFSRVKAVVSISASQNARGQAVSGLIANAGGKSRISDLDVFGALNVSYAYAAVGGVFAEGYTNEVTAFNVSLAVRINVGMFEPSAQVQSEDNIGSFCGYFSGGAISLSGISAFVDIVRNSSDMSSSICVTGLTGYTTGAVFKLQKCHVFGEIALYNYAGMSYYVAGVSTYMREPSTVFSCSFSGNITTTAKSGQYAYVGALGARLYGAELRDCFANSNITVAIGQFELCQASGFLAFSNGGTIWSSIANSSISVDSVYQIARIYIAGMSAGIIYAAEMHTSSCTVHIQFTQAPGKLAGNAIALLAAALEGKVRNCSARGDIRIAAENISQNDCFVAGIVALSQQITLLADVSVTGSIEVPDSFKVAAAFDTLNSKAILFNVLAAIAFPGRSNINAILVADTMTTLAKVFVDCGLAGNNVSQKECRNDLKSQSTADALGAAFGWNSSYNDGYPYLVNLPVYDGAKYVLPASGPFSEDFYYVDTLGYPFPNSDYQICRGACYGTYESPLVRNCTNTTNDSNSYCIQPKLAETDFRTASCIQENAHCNSGASICTSEAELKLNQTDSTYSCELGCPGCVNGHYQNNTCVCNLYYSGINCSTYQCDSDSPACFGDPTMECAADGSECVPTDACTELGCVHGSCVVSSSNNKTQCRCDNMWTGSRCDRCNAYGPECSVSQTECNRLCGAHGHCGTPLTTICTCSLGFGGANCVGCAVGHTAVGDRCVCGDSGGSCQLRQTCVDGVCVADCLLADPYCAECEVADQSVCAKCVKQHTIQDGICQFHLSAAVSTSFAVVLGVAAAVAAALGAVLLFRLLSAKRNGGKQKLVGDGVKLDAVQSGPKSVGKAEKPLLEQVPAIQDVTVEIKIDSARGDK